MSTHFEDVGLFMKTFGQPIYEGFHNPSSEVAVLRLKLILEEFMELFDAMTDDTGFVDNLRGLLREAHDDLDKLDKEDFCYDHVAIADALADIEYVTLGAGHSFGLNLDDCFDEVQRSNMSKLGADGKPMYREDGKVMKGPNYTPPDIAGVLGVGKYYE